ncbi:MAG: hypothetical protein AMXMBFR23_02830 [Chloroflexota bacterium]
MTGVLTGGSREPSGPRARREASSRAPRLQLLGEFVVAGPNGDRVRIPYASQRVVALAALQRRPLLRRLVATRIWPHLAVPSALASLRTAISRMHAAHPLLLTTTPELITLAPQLQVDLVEHEARALEVIRGGELCAALELPTDIFTTPLLAEWDDDWVNVERQRVQELFLHALEASALRLAGDGHVALALHAAYAVLGTDSLRESAARTVIELHLREGNRAQAARIFLDFRERLRLALNVAPSAELYALVEGVVRSRGG